MFLTSWCFGPWFLLSSKVEAKTINQSKPVYDMLAEFGNTTNAEFGWLSKEKLTNGAWPRHQPKPTCINSYYDVVYIVWVRDMSLLLQSAILRQGKKSRKKLTLQTNYSLVPQQPVIWGEMNSTRYRGASRGLNYFGAEFNTHTTNAWRIMPSSSFCRLITTRLGGGASPS